MRIVFFGTPAFAVPSLTALFHSGNEVIAVVTQPDKKRGRKRILAPSPVKQFALERKCRIIQPSTMREQSFLEELTSLAPDLIVVVAYGKILPLSILQLPPKGCINVHASLLPKYRGAAPVQWAIIKGEKTTGVTTIFMDEGLDTGDILLQEVEEIQDEDTADTLGRRLAELGASLLIKTVRGISDATLRRIPQSGTPSYAPPLRKEDGRILWSKNAIEISNMVRGMYPWPCAYCYLGQERIKITRARPSPGSSIPGRIEKADAELIIGTGDGVLTVIELQPEGKRVMSAQEFLCGRRVVEGTFLDGP